MSDLTIKESLRHSKIFKGLPHECLEAITAQGSIAEFKPDRCIIHEGEIGKTLYIIISGQVEVYLPRKSDYSPTKRATRIKLGRLGAGNCLGEYSVIDDNPASASAVTIGPCVLFTLSKNSFEKITGMDDRCAKYIYKNILDVLIKRCRDTDKELDMVCFI